MDAPTVATDRIERSILIRAPRSRVWRALANAEEFGAWFKADLKGQTFAVGQRTRGPIAIEGFRHLMFDVLVERIEPERLMAWRWHPYPMDPAIDYEQEEPTLVTFTLEDTAEGTRLSVAESGFDKVPPERRFEAFRMNSRGWQAQLDNLQRHAGTP
jgi:uncharacterized protein YndB with AHSA1/START domain